MIELIEEQKSKDPFSRSKEAKLATYSNIENTVSSYMSIFETLWMQNTLKAWYRRNVIIGLPNSFEIGKNADPDLDKKVTTQEEISGMFNLLMYALRRILKEGKISVNDMTVQERREKYERSSNSISTFIAEAVSENSLESNAITKEALYEVYKHFCTKYRLAREPIINFGKILKQVHNFVDSKETTGLRRRIWKGVALTDEYIKILEWKQETLESSNDNTTNASN